MNKLGMLVLPLILLMLVSCATVKVELDGLPVPTNVVRGHIPSTNMNVESAVVRFFQEKEGDEYLDTFEYLNPYDGKQKVQLEHLSTFSYIVHVINPEKVPYRLLLCNGSDDKNKKFTRTLYSGNLSRKDFKVDLPIEPESEHHIWYELHDNSDVVFFIGPIVHYEVVGSSPSKTTTSGN